MKNNIRFDLSDYLIHFFRDVDQESNNYILFPEHAGFNNINHSIKLDALFLMRCALRHYKLCASWSYRNGVRTIYGSSPAVCFTDMPLAAFIQTSNERLKRGENIGQYALMLPKNVMFSAGARPVIYALSSEDIKLAYSKNAEDRIIDTLQLPLDEQYRYVTYNPSIARPIDWTHEREWRWPFRGDVSHFNCERFDIGDYEDLEGLPGLQLEDVGIIGAGVIVHGSEDVRKVLYDILTLVDKGIASSHAFKFILQTTKLKSHMDVLEPKALSDFINENIIDLSPYFNVNECNAKKISNEVDCIVKDEISKVTSCDESFGSEFGQSWVWLVDNHSDLTRALIAADRVHVTKEGRYLMELDSISEYPLRKQELICQKVAKRLSNKYSLSCDYFSVLGKCDYDEVPFYTSFTDENHEFYNSTLAVD
ncbi:TPA: DUF4427 domain-containing protein [Vibrio diabolicus]